MIKFLSAGVLVGSLLASSGAVADKFTCYPINEEAMKVMSEYGFFISEVYQDYQHHTYNVFKSYKLNEIIILRLVVDPNGNVVECLVDEAKIDSGIETKIFKNYTDHKNDKYDPKALPKFTEKLADVFKAQSETTPEQKQETPDTPKTEEMPAE